MIERGLSRSRGIDGRREDSHGGDWRATIRGWGSMRRGEGLMVVVCGYCRLAKIEELARERGRARDGEGARAVMWWLLMVAVRGGLFTGMAPE